MLMTGARRRSVPGPTFDLVKIFTMEEEATQASLVPWMTSHGCSALVRMRSVGWWLVVFAEVFLLLLLFSFFSSCRPVLFLAVTVVSLGFLYVGNKEVYRTALQSEMVKVRAHQTAPPAS
jgi:hypothetical protein